MFNHTGILDSSALNKPHDLLNEPTAVIIIIITLFTVG